MSLCPLGHRVIDSTGAHYSMREVEPGLFEYVIGDCDEVEAARQEQPAHPEGDAA